MATETQPLFLATNTAILRYLLNAVPDAYLILDQDRRVVFVNEAVHAMTQFPSTDAQGRRPGDLLRCQHSFEHDGCGSTETCKTCGAFRAITAGLEGREWIDECHITQLEGTALDLRVRTTPLTINGETYVIFTLHDIADEKRRRSLERTFFHDVLNTTSIISSYAQLLRNHPDDLEEILPELNMAAERLIDEINAQKNLLAAENGELRPEPTVVAPAALLRELRNNYINGELCSEKSIALVLPPDECIMMTDKTLLRRVLGNMLKNALEASLPGDTVTMSAHFDGERVMFQVHNPMFMPRRVQLQVFKRSFSTKGVGRGLGTYSMRLLTENYLNGEVSFTTDQDTGTTFYAEYPLTLH